jgi:large subunit ribosomal protein L10
MAISRDKKNALVTEFSELLDSSKMVVAAQYGTLSVADLQDLRRQAREAGVSIKVIKNRLVKVAMKASLNFKDVDAELLAGQLLYAASSEDEVAPAQVLASFAKTHEAVQLVAGLDGSGKLLDTAGVKMLADLPTKDQLRGMLVSTIAAPMTQFMGVINGAQRGFAQVLSQRAEQISA